MVRTVFTDEDRRNIKAIAVELIEIRKLIENLSETLVNLSDKKLLESFQASPKEFSENKVLNYKEALEEQIDFAEREMRS